MESLKHSQEVLNKAIVDLSNLTKGLHSDRIAQVGLADSIRFELYALKNAGILQVHFQRQGTEIAFSEEKSIFLFRIFQETINNILKHAKATEVDVNLDYQPNLFCLEIKDNGVGFNVTEMQESTTSTKGVGLKSVFNRAQLIGAQLAIDSKPGYGTKTTIRLPLTIE